MEHMFDVHFDRAVRNFKGFADFFVGLALAMSFKTLFSRSVSSETRRSLLKDSSLKHSAKA